MLRILSVFLSFCLFTTSCSQLNINPSGQLDLSTDNGTVQLQISASELVNADGSGLSTQALTPSAVDLSQISHAVISIIGPDGNYVYLNQVFPLIVDGSGQIFTSPIILPGGTNIIETFLVQNDRNETLYILPLNGSDVAAFVSEPSPKSISVLAQTANAATVEVVSLDGLSVDQFGLTSIFLDIVDVARVAVSASIFDETGSLIGGNVRIEIHENGQLVRTEVISSGIIHDLLLTSNDPATTELHFFAENVQRQVFNMADVGDFLNVVFREYSGEVLFEGLLFGKGPVGDLFPEVRTLIDPNIRALIGSGHDAEIAQFQDQIMHLASARDPKFFDDFKAEMESGDPVIIKSRIQATGDLMRSVAGDLVGHPVDEHAVIVSDPDVFKHVAVLGNFPGEALFAGDVIAHSNLRDLLLDIQFEKEEEEDDDSAVWYEFDVVVAIELAVVAVIAAVIVLLAGATTATDFYVVSRLHTDQFVLGISDRLEVLEFQTHGL